MTASGSTARGSPWDFPECHYRFSPPVISRCFATGHSHVSMARSITSGIAPRLEQHGFGFARVRHEIILARVRKWGIREAVNASSDVRHRRRNGDAGTIAHSRSTRQKAAVLYRRRAGDIRFRLRRSWPASFDSTIDPTRSRLPPLSVRARAAMYLCRAQRPAGHVLTMAIPGSPCGIGGRTGLLKRSLVTPGNRQHKRRDDRPSDALLGAQCEPKHSTGISGLTVGRIDSSTVGALMQEASARP